MARFVALIAVLLLVSNAYGFAPNSRNDTDNCLNDISQWTQLIPKTIEDVLKSDILAIMVDVSQATQLINHTKQSCGNFSFLDIVNQTSFATFVDCYNSTTDVIVVFNQLIADVSSGNVSAIIQDVGALIAAGNNVYKQCNATVPILENPRLLANFFNSTLCWATHERSVIVFKELLYQIQQRNISGIIPLVLPFVGTSAEAIRQCSIYSSSSSMSLSMTFPRFSYRFFESNHSNQSNKSEQCYGDILALVDGFLPILTDIDTRNFFKLFDDVKKVVPRIAHTLRDCPSVIREIDFKPYINQSALGTLPQCVSDIKDIANLTKDAFKSIKRGDFNRVISDVMSIIHAGKSTVRDCTNGGHRIDLSQVLNWFPSQQCTESANKTGQLAREARDAFNRRDQEKFEQLLPLWIEAARVSFNICHRAPLAF